MKVHVHLGWGLGVGVLVWGLKRAVLCCIASGKSSVSRFSLQKFDIWYLMF